MTDRSKFEEMLERLVNEDRAGAEELFHEIVVEASREIYQSILESEDEDEDLEEESDEESDDDLDEEMDDEDSEELDEMFGLDEFAPGDGSDAAMGMGGDATDDMMGDVEDDMGDDDMDDMDDMGDDDMGDEEGLTDRVDDLEDALEQLTAEFDKMMGGNSDHEEPDDDNMGGPSDNDADNMGDEDEMEFGDEEDTEEKESFAFEAKKTDAKMKADAAKKKADAAKKTEKKTAGEELREYVEKIGGDRYNAYGKMGDNGANTKSLVAGKNDMGGTTANILASKTGEKGVEANKGQLKGNGVFKGTPKDMNTKNVNVPGSKTATKLSPVAKGHGAEKKGAGETADKSAGSMLNGAPKRAK